MHVTLQPLTPFDRSVVWRFHDAYFAQRGTDAWTQGEVPFYSTSNYATATQHARFFADAVAELEKTGRLGPNELVWVLEVGGGVGKFAANFLRALETSSGAFGAALFGRIRYVFSDYAEKGLRQVIAGPTLAAHVAAGRVIPALYDLRAPARLTALDQAEAIPPLTMVVANYVSCVLAMKNLQYREGTWIEQWVSVTAEVDASIADMPMGELVEHLIAHPTQENLVRNFKSEYDWRDTPLDVIFPDATHQAALTALVRDMDDATIGYPYGFLDFVRGSSHLLAPGGFVLVNDYGSIEKKDLAGLHERRPQIYGNSLANAINFAVFDAFGEATGWQVMRSNDVLGSLHSCAMRPADGWTDAERAAFARHYVAWRGGDDILDYSAIAKLCVERKEYDRALRFYRRCIELEPENPDHRYRAGEAAIEGGNYLMAIDYLETGLAMEGAHRVLDFEFQLGRATCLNSQYALAIAWYEKALERDNHPTTWTNVGVLYENSGRFEDAYRCFKKAMTIDPSYARGKERMQSLREAWWRRMIESVEGPGAVDPLAPPPTIEVDLTKTPALTPRVALAIDELPPDEVEDDEDADESEGEDAEGEDAEGEDEGEGAEGEDAEGEGDEDAEGEDAEA